ncbi:MAG: RluA family pseudouridine synthase [Bradymonadaceae bacterium]
MTKTQFSFLVDPEDEGTRLDVFLAEQDDPPLTRSQVRRALDRGEITVNSERVKAGYKLRGDDVIRWDYAPPPGPRAVPQDIPLTFLYEDEFLAVVDKPAGMVVHPSPGHPDGTLVNAILHHFERIATVGDELRPGIVHRLDKDTSGALVVTKTDPVHHHLAEQFREHTIDRVYHALVHGPGLAERGTFDTLHGRAPNHRIRFSGKVDKGRRAVTHFEVLERFDQGVCLVQCKLETGRTHQIRMHFFEANAPLLGDELYGGKVTSSTPLIARQALHAVLLGFEHLDGRRITCEAPYPADFAGALEALRAGKSWRG